MAREPVWKSITATIEGEIAAGLYRAGEKLPTEAALSTRFGVNRHTVRRALSDMAERGLVRARRGSGVFVQAEPLEYPLGKRVRFHRAIAATGRLPEKERLRVETRPASQAEARALALAPGTDVVIYEGLSLSGGVPIAHFISAFPATLPGLADALTAQTSVTEGLRRAGVTDYLRAETRINADSATATQALHLGVAAGGGLLRTTAVNTDTQGRPVEYGLTWFAGDKVTLTVALDQER